MPDRIAENLVMFIRRNSGTLSRRRREGKFGQLRDDEVLVIERIVADAFSGFDDIPHRPRTSPAADDS